MQYILVVPPATSDGPQLTQTVIVTPNTFIIHVPDGDDVYDVDPRTAADNPRYGITTLIENLEWSDS